MLPGFESWANSRDNVLQTFLLKDLGSSRLHSSYNWQLILSHIHKSPAPPHEQKGEERFWLGSAHLGVLQKRMGSDAVLFEHWALHESVFSTSSPQPDRPTHLHTSVMPPKTPKLMHRRAAFQVFSQPHRSAALCLQRGGCCAKQPSCSQQSSPAGKGLGVMLDENLNVSQRCCLAAQKRPHPESWADPSLGNRSREGILLCSPETSLK